jgi:hypothetical protein
VRFVLVNGRMPFRQDFCAHCREPISEGGYLRDVRTRRCYCGAECYALKSDHAMMRLDNQANAS